MAQRDQVHAHDVGDELELVDCVILADAGTGLRQAVREFFTTAVLVPSLWHAQNAIEQALTKQSGPNAAVLSAPANRPDRRRFTITVEAEPVVKAHKRKDRARHASR